MLVPEQVRALHEGHRKGFMANGTARPMGIGLELAGRRRDGTVFPIDVSLAPFSQWTVAASSAPSCATPASGVARKPSLRADQRDHPEPARRGTDRGRSWSSWRAGRAVLVEATFGWVVVPSASDELVISAADGEGADSVVGVRIPPATSIANRAMTQGTSIPVADLSVEPAVPHEMKALGFGPGLYCPLGADGRVLGALVVARPSGAPQFTKTDTALVEVFANSAVVALTLGETRVELDQLQATAERERIGRDLHDTVIQRLFALGMSLQSIERLATGPVAERIDSCRRRPRRGDPRHPRDDLPPRAADHGRLGAARGCRHGRVWRPPSSWASPRVSASTGRWTPSRSGQLQPQVIAVLTEALSNVVRHAACDRGRGTSSRPRTGRLLVSVADNGIGPPSGPSAGNGLRNIADRARALEGSVAIAERRPSGTLRRMACPDRLSLLVRAPGAARPEER